VLHPISAKIRVGTTDEKGGRLDEDKLEEYLVRHASNSGERFEMSVKDILGCVVVFDLFVQRQGATVNADRVNTSSEKECTAGRTES